MQTHAADLTERALFTIITTRSEASSGDY
jgi:hypothetical protein